MKSVPLLRGLVFVAYFHLLSMAVGSFLPSVAQNQCFLLKYTMSPTASSTETAMTAGYP